MKNFEMQPKPSRLEEIKNMISNSREKIEQEFGRSANSWLACFGTRVFVIETSLANQKTQAEIGLEKYKVICEKLENLKQRLEELKQEYPDKNTIPPEGIKQELLNALNNLV